MGFQYPSSLQRRIDLLKARRVPQVLGGVSMAGPLIMAPMSAIGRAPFRLLMEELGAGATVSELISCHGLGHGNARTLRMLSIDPRERHVGLQIFGQCPQAMARACAQAQEAGPKFIDLNLGCPVRKVVSKGAGAALLRDVGALPSFFRAIKRAISVPLSIKIRTGWDEGHRNAHEVIQVAQDEGVSLVCVHGRTRCQQYQGLADWNYVESLAQQAPIPIVGNGDLHTPLAVARRLAHTHCQGLMLARGPLRNPFLFLESYQKEGEGPFFFRGDHWPVIQRLRELLEDDTNQSGPLLVQLKKHILWMSSTFSGAASFRAQLCGLKQLPEVLNRAQEFFESSPQELRPPGPQGAFMMGGHG